MPVTYDFDFKEHSFKIDCILGKNGNFQLFQHLLTIYKELKIFILLKRFERV